MRPPDNIASRSNGISHLSSAGIFAKRRAIAAVLIILTFGLYLPVGTHAWLSYDDDIYLTENYHVLTGLNFSNLLWAFTNGYACNWHPITWISHMVDCSIWGLNSGPHHLTNAVLHSLNAALLFLVLQTITGAEWRSAVVAALFAWHPLHVESVAWAAERKDILSTLFWLLTTAAYVKYTRTHARRDYFMALILFALGLMSKPMLVTLPFTLVLLDIWPLRRFGLFDRSAFPVRPRVAMHRILLEKIPFLTLSLISSAVTFIVQRNGGALGDLQIIPLPARLGNAALSYFSYLEHTLYPFHFAVFYPYTLPISLFEFALSALSLIAITAFAILQIKVRPWFGVGWFWYLGTLVPVIGIVQVGAQSMADRYTYLPLVGIFIILVWGACDIAMYFSISKSIIAAGTLLILGVCIVLSYRQIGCWKNSEILFAHALKVTGANVIAENHLAAALMDEGKLDEGKEHLYEALSLWPACPESHFLLGNILLAKSDPAKALEEFRKAARFNPSYTKAHYVVGTLLMDKGDIPGALECFQRAVQLDPDFIEARNNLGICLARMGQYKSALQQFQAVLRLRPNSEQAKQNVLQIQQALPASDAAN